LYHINNQQQQRGAADDELEWWLHICLLFITLGWLTKTWEIVFNIGNNYIESHCCSCSMPKYPRRGAGFGRDEVSCFLDAIEKHLPISPNEWDMVEIHHAKYYPDSARTKDSLKRKFLTLHRTKIPTGDPNCPIEVRRAKRIYEEMKKKTELSDAETDDEDDAEEDDEGEDEVEVEANKKPNDDGEAYYEQQDDDDETLTSTTELVTTSEPSSEGSKKRANSTTFRSPIANIGSKKKKHNFKVDEQTSMDKFMSMMVLQRQSESDERKAQVQLQMQLQQQQFQQQQQQFQQQQQLQNQQNQQFMQMLMLSMASNNNRIPWMQNILPNNNVQNLHSENNVVDEAIVGEFVQEVSTNNEQLLQQNEEVEQNEDVEQNEEVVKLNEQPYM
jgi:hypothetical protein